MSVVGHLHGAVPGAFLRRLRNPALFGVAFADLRNPVTFNSRL